MAGVTQLKTKMVLVDGSHTCHCLRMEAEKENVNKYHKKKKNGFINASKNLMAIDRADTKDTPQYKVICYVGSWAYYRPGSGKFRFEDIDPSLCTHLVYAFATMSVDGRLAAFDPYLDLKANYGLGGYEQMTSLKHTHGIRTLLAVGGWNEGSTKYSAIAANSTGRKAFARSALTALKNHDFDGLDLDWEYPGLRGGAAEDKDNFVLLLKVPSTLYPSKYSTKDILHQRELISSV
ncbi:Glyco_18 [Cordylochernes scorpioides]|uniref:Glyco_18 n=1 Tax=Cordylochernes scorpioides TaxID=51811 RepID=A0ABY6LDE9_9ARAC|nr:Glyco_18 [Cordylochernes scorpioides]